MEDNLRILKIEYLIGFFSNLNLSSMDQTEIEKKDQPQWKTTLKYQKLNITATSDQVFLKF